MNQFNWSSLKSERLKKIRGVSFEDVIHGQILDVLDHPIRPHQRRIIFEY